jgi:hypothetical protein
MTIRHAQSEPEPHEFLTSIRDMLVDRSNRRASRALAGLAAEIADDPTASLTNEERGELRAEIDRAHD